MNLTWQHTLKKYNVFMIRWNGITQVWISVGRCSALGGEHV